MSRKLQRPPRDVKGIYRGKCDELANRLGYHRSEIWNTWGWVALAVEFEMKSPREYAESAAFLHVVSMYDKAGSVPS